jgi:hypothetical protein
LTNALAFLPYANGVHYDAEGRRSLTHELMTKKVLPPMACATDDFVGIWYEGTQPTSVVGDFAIDPQTGPAAYRVELVNGDIVETRFGVGRDFS